MTDLCIGPMGNPFTVYVAITRVQGRGKLLIFRPFDAAPFQKGIGLGRDLLLRHLRGDAINWQALLAKYCEERVCSTCAERKQSTAFTPGQWKRSDTDRVCRECTKHYADAGTPWQCNVCKLWHVEANFPEKHRQRQCSFFRVCLTCEVKKPCFKCGVPKPEKDYGPAAWKARHADRRCCRDCVLKLRGYWSCADCLERKPHAEFTAWKENRDYRQNGTQLCNTCISLALVCQIARRANQRLTPLRQRVQRQRHQAILEEVRKEIQQRTAERTSHAWPTATGSASSTGVLEVAMQSAQDERNSAKSSQDGQAAARVYTYTACPSCQQCVQSSVFTGKVNTRGHCGRQFRVAAGRVCTRYTHACPTCNTKVESKQPHGRIRAQHTNARGRTCKTTEWLVAAPNEPGPQEK